MPLDITEYASLARDASGGTVLTGLEPSRVVQQVAVGATSAQSQPMSDVTRFVRLHSDVACRVKFAVSAAGVVADQSCQRIGAGGTEFFGVAPGTVIAVIESA